MSYKNGRGIRCPKQQRWYGGTVHQCDLVEGHPEHHCGGGIAWVGDGDLPEPDVNIQLPRTTMAKGAAVHDH